MWILHLLPESVWVLARSSRFLLNSINMHLRLREAPSSPQDSVSSVGPGWSDLAVAATAGEGSSTPQLS